jgi:hypothetical protein
LKQSNQLGPMVKSWSNKVQFEFGQIININPSSNCSTNILNMFASHKVYSSITVWTTKTLETSCWNTCNILLKHLQHLIETLLTSTFNYWNTWNLLLKHMQHLVETPATSYWNTFNIHFQLLKHLKPLVETHATSCWNTYNILLKHF